MVPRIDAVLPSAPEPTGVQVVGYDSGAGGLIYDPRTGAEGTPDPPALLIANDGELDRIRLETGRELAYTLGDRHCAGRIDGDRHEACPEPAAPYCDVHTSEWPCARCRGECSLPLESCREEHAVYLAAFAPDVFKVGVTRLWRLHTRLREQGADRAAHIRTVSNGRLARRIERELATELPEQVPTHRKAEGLHRTVDADVWASLLGEHSVIERFEFEYGLGLTDRPVAETLASGTVLGSQGRLVVLERTGSTYAVDLRDLVGYELESGRSNRQLQSSLAAFG